MMNRHLHNPVVPFTGKSPEQVPSVQPGWFPVTRIPILLITLFCFSGCSDNAELSQSPDRAHFDFDLVTADYHSADTGYADQLQSPTNDIIIATFPDSVEGVVLSEFLLEWGLPQEHVDDVIEQTTWIIAGQQCESAPSIISAESEKVVTIKCLTGTLPGTIEAFLIQGSPLDDSNVTNNVELNLLLLSSIESFTPYIYDLDIWHSEFSLNLSETGLELPDSTEPITEIIEDMMDLNRCNRTAFLSLGNDLLTSEISCVTGPDLGPFQSQRIYAKFAPDEVEVEFLLLTHTSTGQRSFSSVQNTVHRELIHISTTEELLSMITLHYPDALSSDDQLVSEMTRFIEEGGSCSRLNETRNSLTDIQYAFELLPLSPMHWFEGCALRASSYIGPSNATRNALTLIAYRPVGTGEVTVRNDTDILTSDVDYALLKVFATAEEQISLSELMVTDIHTEPCPSNEQLSEELPDSHYMIRCIETYSGLLEMGQIYMRAIVETGFESASLLDAEPTVISTLWMQTSGHLGSVIDEPAENIIWVQFPPDIQTISLIEGEHESSVSTHLISWGLSPEASLTVVERLDSLIENPDEEIVPVLSLEDNATVYLNRSLVDEEEKQWFLLHGIRRGGPELEILIFPSYGELSSGDVFTLSDVSESTLFETTDTILQEFAVPESSLNEIANIFTEITLSHSPCPGIITLEHESLNGSIKIDCTDYDFSLSRPHLSVAGNITLDFLYWHLGLEATSSFQIMEINFLRPLEDTSEPSYFVTNLFEFRPYYESPTLPPVLKTLLPLELQADLSIVSETLVEDWNLSEIEANLVVAELDQAILLRSCEATESIALQEEDATITFGCQISNDLSFEPDLYMANLLNNSYTQFTIIIAGIDDPEKYVLHPTLTDGFIDSMLMTADLEPKLNEEIVNQIIEIFRTTPGILSCALPFEVVLRDETVLTLQCSEWSSFVNDVDSIGNLDDSIYRIIKWYITDGTSEGYLYWYDEPDLRGEEVVLDSFFINTFLSPSSD